MREGLVLEQKYVSVSRRGGRQAAEPPLERSSRTGRGRKQKRSLIATVFWGCYKVVAVISALIVAGYIGFRVMVHPPEQATVPPTVQTGGKVDSSESGGGAVSEEELGPVRRDGVYNILLAGTDNDGYRTDTMMVMSYDVINQTVGVVSVPRDTIIDRGQGKNPKLVYGSGGVEQRVEDISGILGVPIDYYIKVNLKGFIKLVDYVGGVDFYVPCDMDYDDPYQELSIHFTKGTQHLTGQQAMEVARFRKNNDLSGYTDVGRTQTQQKLLVALAKKVLAWNNVTKLNGFVEIFNQYVDTDLALTDMLYFASQAIYLDTGTGVETCTLQGNGEVSFRGYAYCYALDPETTLDAVNRLINPYTQALTLEDMNLVQGT
ncbi:MAG: LCP family protein [Lawsonibacter sp.]